jgi:hypothetical protein
LRVHVQPFLAGLVVCLELLDAPLAYFAKGVFVNRFRDILEFGREAWPRLFWRGLSKFR